MNTHNQKTLTVSEEDLLQFNRLDQLLSTRFEEISRTVVKNLFEKGLISFSNDDTQKVELKKIPKLGTVVTVDIPVPVECRSVAQNIPLDIMFEDEHLLIVNKQAGLVVHPAPGHPDGTLVNAILFHCNDLTGVGDEKRPGIVHRLDKGTSGVMVVAKTQKCHERLVHLFSEHDIKRQYHALVVRKQLPIGGTLSSTIGRHKQNRQKMDVNVKDGKQAVTHYRTLKQFNRLALVECTLETGRTHQIRVHLSKMLQASILNDPMYASPAQQKKSLTQEMIELLGSYSHPLLHAKILGFKHPITNQELYFEANYPEMFQILLDQLNNEASL